MKVFTDIYHVQIRWDFTHECLFTEEKLTKLHYRFSHPGVVGMKEVPERGSTDNIVKDIRSMFGRTQSKCKECFYFSL